jgi:hypothetical protein
MATPAAQIPSVHTSIASIVAERSVEQSPLAVSTAIIKDQLDCGCVGTCTCGVKPKISQIIAPPDVSEEIIVDPFAVSFSTKDESESRADKTGDESRSDSVAEEATADSKDQALQLLSGKLECGCVGICNCHEKPKLQEIVDPTKIEGEIIVDAFASDGFQVGVELETNQKVDIESIISDKATGVDQDNKPDELLQASTVSEEQLAIKPQPEPTTSEIPVTAQLTDALEIARSDQNLTDSPLKTEMLELKPNESLSNIPGEIAIDLKSNDILNAFAEKISDQSAENQYQTPRAEEKIPEAIDVSVKEQLVSIPQDSSVIPAVATEAQSDRAQLTDLQVNPDALKTETLSKSEPSANIEKIAAPEDAKAQQLATYVSETKTEAVQTLEYRTNTSTLSESSNGSPDKIQDQSSKAQVASIDSGSVKTFIVADQAVRVIEKLSYLAQKPSVSPSISTSVNSSAGAQTVREPQTALNQLNEQLKVTTSKIEKLIAPNQVTESLVNRQVTSQAYQATGQNNAQQILLRMINAVSQNNKTDQKITQNNPKISNTTEATVQKDLRTSTSKTISTEKFLIQIKTVDALINQPQIQARIKELDFVLTRVKVLSENIAQKESVHAKNPNEPSMVTEKINQELILLKTQHAQLRALQAQLVQEFELLIKSQCQTLLDADDDFITISESEQIFEGRTIKRRRLTRQTQNPSDAKSIIKKNLEREAQRKKAQVEAQVSSQVIVTSSKISGALTSATPKRGVSRGPSASLQGAFHGESRNGFVI